MIINNLQTQTLCLSFKKKKKKLNNSLCWSQFTGFLRTTRGNMKIEMFSTHCRSAHKQGTFTAGLFLWSRSSVYFLNELKLKASLNKKIKANDDCSSQVEADILHV